MYYGNVPLSLDGSNELKWFDSKKKKGETRELKQQGTVLNVVYFFWVFYVLLIILT